MHDNFSQVISDQVWDRTPPSQSAVHFDQPDHSDITQSTGHFFWLHFFVRCRAGHQSYGRSLANHHTRTLQLGWAQQGAHVLEHDPLDALAAQLVAIGQVACRQHTTLSSSCLTSALVWELDEWLAFNNDEEARNSLVIKLLGKLVGLEVGQVACCQHQSPSPKACKHQTEQQRRRTTTLPCHELLDKLIGL